MARHRRQVLSLVFAEPVAQGRITIDERHVRADAWHCATGRVTRDGEPVEPAIAPPSLLRAAPWLPCDEALLQRIVDVVAGVAPLSRRRKRRRLSRRLLPLHLLRFHLQIRAALHFM
ncbi:hypothetical protein [Burkholderia cenocepacia]|uniref:hypothetical protein n=1 Tax=Burkholderia cenocepacia TaxID=95486 RepID=UPI001CF2B5C3|nr:hypothetical protein [Burkholderia cenocepacia]